MRGFVILRLLPLLAFTGCTTVIEHPCASADWQAIGYQDGRNGTAATHLLKHQNTCVDYGIIPDRDAYLVGWSEGVAEYCRPDNGFSVGRRGAPYPSVCPGQLQEAFYAAYQDGMAIYRVQQDHSIAGTGDVTRAERVSDGQTK